MIMARIMQAALLFSFFITLFAAFVLLTMTSLTLKGIALLVLVTAEPRIGMNSIEYRMLEAKQENSKMKEFKA